MNPSEELDTTPTNSLTRATQKQKKARKNPIDDLMEKFIHDKNASIKTLIGYFQNGERLDSFEESELASLLEVHMEEHPSSIATIAKKLHLSMAKSIPTRKEGFAPLDEGRKEKLSEQEIIPIDEVLGNYNPDEGEITLFVEEIKKCAENLNVKGESCGAS